MSQWAVLVGLGVSGALLVVNELSSKAPPLIDARYATGTHLIFVFVAPSGDPDEEHQEAVTQARSAMRSYAAGEGYLFATVGISYDWIVEEGLEQLGRFGTFDEVIVGRGWLNTGIDVYVRQFGGTPSVPQLVVFLQDVDVSSRPTVVREPRELFRAIGANELQAWARSGFALPSTPSGWR